LLKRLDSANFDVTSAGIDCGEMHPLAIEVIKEIGVDLEGRVPKAMHDVLNLRFDFVITLCDRARVACPGFPKAELVHWRFDDPLAAMEDSGPILVDVAGESLNSSLCQGFFARQMQPAVCFLISSIAFLYLWRSRLTSRVKS